MRFRRFKNIENYMILYEIAGKIKISEIIRKSAEISKKW